MERPLDFDKKGRRPISIASLFRAGLPGVLSYAVLASPLSAQAPDEDWKTLETEHVTVTYPAELRDLATRVADRAERAYAGLARTFDDPPDASIDFVVTDHLDISNGFAGVAPWNRVTIFAPPPVGGFDLAYFDDWTELVVTHEMAHIFHLDRRGWLGDVVMAVFGRPPVRWPVFPNSALPTWTIEGLAVWYESSLTDAGRILGTYHDMVLRAAVLEGDFESLDQVSGQSAVWPDGNRPYVYGSMFFDYLNRTYGPGHMGEFAQAVDGQIIPFRVNAAARKSFGVNFKDAFGSWTQELDAQYARQVAELERRGPLTRTEPIATRGRWALYPKVSPDGATVAFARSDGSSDTQIHLTDPAGRASSKLTRANRVSQLDWTPDGRVVFSQIEYVDPYRAYNDLFVVDPDGGGERRVTSGARLDYPSVSPDGRHALAVRQDEGLTWIVSVDLATGDVTPVVEPVPDVHWSYPAWSPDGRWIAAGRWEPGAYYDIVILDAAGQEVSRITRDRAIDLAPTWSPDGRYLLWASDRTGIPNILAVEVDAQGGAGPIRQVTNLATGGSYPDVDPGGQWLYLSVYHSDGWHVERVPFDPSTWLDPGPPAARFADDGAPWAQEYARRIDSPESGYNPFPSLWPRYWEPTYRQGETTSGVQVLGPSFGLRTTAFDIVERHVFSAALRFEPKGNRFDGGMAYSFYGLGNPVLSLAAEQSYSSFGIRVTDPVDEGQPEPSPRSVFFVDRERELRAQATFIRRRVRTFLSLTLGASYVWEHQELLNDVLDPDSVFVPSRPNSGLPQVNATLGFNTTRTHPFSISPEDGISGFARVRRRWDATVPDSLAATVSDRSWGDVTGEARLYKSVDLPGFSNHVLAVRASGGSAWDSGADPGFYSIGGASGQGERITGLDLLSANNLLFPVRGFARGIRQGARAWTASVEYRFPLARINRGVGDFPLYFDWMSGSLFFDAGNAWGPSDSFLGYENPRSDGVASTGAELVVSGLPLWTASTVLRTGVAVPVAGGSGASVYVRLGIAF